HLLDELLRSDLVVRMREMRGLAAGRGEQEKGDDRCCPAHPMMLAFDAPVALADHRQMPIAPSNGIEIFYDTFGANTDPALVLIRGLGSQMISWREPFCEMLAERGFFVVRFDNRDVGLSSKLDGPYTIDAMAADTVGLMDHLRIDAAHIAGMSM